MSSDLFSCKSLIILVITVMLAIVALSPATGYAQNSIEELAKHENAAGYDRVGTTGRVFSELGMGFVGIVISAVPLGLGFLHPYFFAVTAPITALIVTPITAEMVYQGGRLTGGRSEHWAVYAGGYAGFGIGLLTALLMIADYNFIFVTAAAIPIFSLVGSIVGYELSDKKETNGLISERDRLMGSAPMRSAPIMINLYTGTF